MKNITIAFITVLIFVVFLTGFFLGDAYGRLRPQSQEIRPGITNTMGVNGVLK